MPFIFNGIGRVGGVGGGDGDIMTSDSVQVTVESVG